MSERRREKRYAVPEIYTKYISLRIRGDQDEFQTVDLLDFSLEGIKIRNSSSLPVNSSIECTISIPKSLSREISFMSRIRYCIQEGPGEHWLIGAEVIQSGKNLWLEVFREVHDFIKEKMGEIY